VTIPRVVLPSLPPPGPYALGGEEHRYLVRVRRVRPGETIEILDGRGAAARALVVRHASDALHLDVSPPCEPPPVLPLTLALGLGRPEPLARIVRAAAELGVDAVAPLSTERSLSRAPAALGALADRLRRVAREALRVGGRARTVDVEPPRSTTEWVRLPRPGSAALLLDAAGEPIVAAVRRRLEAGPPDRWFLAVGPEGGFTAVEREAFGDAGFVPVALGAVNLRVETAAVAALGTLRALVG
jgi:16S rRNA (uracil1498-N3)-methyltransferase